MIPKPEPHKRVKARRKRQQAQETKRVRAAVFERDGGRCRVCGGLATEMHELRFRSLGGKRSLENSIAVCNHTGNDCHRKLQEHMIQVTLSPRVGANGLIKFWLPNITRRPAITWFS